MNLLFPLLLSAVGLLSSCTVTAQSKTAEPQTNESDLLVRGKLLDRDLSADADLYIVNDGRHVKVGQVRSDETLQYTFTVQNAKSWPVNSLETFRTTAKVGKCDDSDLFIVDTKQAATPYVYVDVEGVRYRVDAISERQDNGRVVERTYDNITYSYGRGAVRGSIPCSNRDTAYYELQLWPGWNVGRGRVIYNSAGTVITRHFNNYAPAFTLETTFRLVKAL